MQWEGEKERIPIGVRNSEGDVVVGAEALEVWKQAWWTLGVEDLDTMKFDGRFAREVREYVRALKSRMRVSDRREPEGKGQELNVEIGIDEVRAAIKRLLRGKAAGEDGIVNELFMYGGKPSSSCT